MRAARRTTRARVVLGIVIAVVLPSEMFALALLFTGWPGSGFAALLVFAPVVGLILGSPFLAAACAAWCFLHRARRHSAAWAVLIGLAVGTALAAVYYWTTPAGGRSPIAMAVPVMVGMLTGYAVWRVVYGDQKRFELDTSAFD